MLAIHEVPRVLRPADGLELHHVVRPGCGRGQHHGKDECAHASAREYSGQSTVRGPQFGSSPMPVMGTPMRYATDVSSLSLYTPCCRSMNRLVRRPVCLPPSSTTGSRSP